MDQPNSIREQVAQNLDQPLSERAAEFLEMLDEMESDGWITTEGEGSDESRTFTTTDLIGWLEGYEAVDR